MANIKCDNLTADNFAGTGNFGASGIQLSIPTASGVPFKILRGTTSLSGRGATTITFPTAFTGAYGVAIIAGAGSPHSEYRNAIYVEKTQANCTFRSRHDEATYFAYIICGI